MDSAERLLKDGWSEAANQDLDLYEGFTGCDHALVFCRDIMYSARMARKELLEDYCMSKEAEAELGVCRQRIHQLIEAGILKVKKLGRYRLIEKRSIEAYKGNPNREIYSPHWVKETHTT